MGKILTWILLTCIFYIPGRFTDHPHTFPSEKVLKAYKLLLNDTLQDIPGVLKIRAETIVPMPDTNLRNAFPGTQFYFFVIQNGAHWKYNGGNIYTIAAVSNDEEEIRLLLPLGYCENSANLITFLEGKEINSHKEETCKAIVKFFLLTKRQNDLCCDIGYQQIFYETAWHHDTLTVTTNYQEKCCLGWVKEKNGEMEMVASTCQTHFVFEGDILKTIRYEDWRK